MGIFAPILSYFASHKDAFTSIGAVGTLAIFSLGLWQYRRAETWKKSEFIAKLYKEFVEDAACQRAMWMIDWHSRPINFGTEAHPDIVDYDEGLLPGALRTTDNKRKFTETEMKIRDTFDSFFNYIDQFERAMQNNLVQPEQVFPYFEYWIEMLAGKRHMTAEARTCVMGYIDGYGFKDVRSFLDRWPRQ